MLRLHHTLLLLLLLACWQQQEALSPLDAMRWALDGRLPYLAFPGHEGAPLQQYRNILGPATLTVAGAAAGAAAQRACVRAGARGWLAQQGARAGAPSPALLPAAAPSPAAGVPAPNWLHTQAAELAARLGLACPPINAALWMERFAAELELPRVRGVGRFPGRACWVGGARARTAGGAASGVREGAGGAPCPSRSWCRWRCGCTPSTSRPSWCRCTSCGLPTTPGPSSWQPYC